MRAAVKGLVLAWILISVIFLVVEFAGYGVRLYRQPGISMAPTIARGQFLLALQLPFPLPHVRRDSLVVYRVPDNPSRLFTGRVVGLEGDTVAVVHEHVVLNGAALEESYAIWDNAAKNVASPDYKLETPELYAFGPETVPGGAVFVLNDNRTMCCDSRTLGMIQRGWIHGVVLAIVKQRA